MFEMILFWLLAAGVVLCSAMVVLPRTGRNPLYGALLLVVSFIFMAGLYVLLMADIMAVLQVMVYAGAIMVLFMFVIMLLNLRDKDLATGSLTAAKSLGLIVVVMIAVKVALVVAPAAQAIEKNVVAAGGAMDFSDPAQKAAFGTIEGIGDLLFRQFLFPFELTSILLLIAVIGAVVLAKRTL